MVPFTRAKLKDENPTQFASKADVARAKREAMAHAEDLNADLARRVNDVTNRVAGLEKREPTAAVTGPSYFASIYDNGRFRSVDDANALVVENVRLRGERDELAARSKRQAQTISDVTLGCIDLRKENAALREERGELQLELAKKNDALRFSLTERDLRLATIRSKAAAVPEDWRISSRSVRDLLEACL